MADGTWDEYLFKKFNIVAVNPWRGASLTLLDAFTKVSNTGIFNHGLLLAPKGAVTDLAQNPSADPSALPSQLQEARAGRGTHIIRGDLVPICADVKSSSNMLASLANVVSANSRKSKSQAVQVSGVSTCSIGHSFLVGALLGQETGCNFKPDPRNPRMPKKWDRILWVVTEIYYAKSLKVGRNELAIARAEADPSTLVAVETALKGKFEVSKATNGTVVLEVPENGDPFPIGFKAMRLLYDEEGELLAPGGIEQEYMGKIQPKTRSAIDEWLDPDKHSAFHMKDLFRQDDGGTLEAMPMLDAEDAAEEATSSAD